MSLLRTAYIKLVKDIIALRPEIAMRVVVDSYWNELTKSISGAKLHPWNLHLVPKDAREFEDLSFLFNSSNLNRGVARLDFDEACLIFKTIKSLRPARGVEIGRFNGGSTVLISLAVGQHGKLVSIDISPKSDSACHEVLERIGTRERIDLVQADATTINLDDQVDFAFIDGNHTYESAKADHLRFGRCVRPGGFVIHHDMAKTRERATQWKSLKTLRQDIIDRQKEIFRLYNEIGSVSIYQRISNAWCAF